MALVQYLGKLGQGMSDLICANRKNFNHAACPPRCETHQYAYAYADTPACARFSRQPEAQQFTPESLSNRRFNDECRWSHPTGQQAL